MIFGMESKEFLMYAFALIGVIFMSYARYSYTIRQRSSKEPLLYSDKEKMLRRIALFFALTAITLALI